MARQRNRVEGGFEVTDRFGSLTRESSTVPLTVSQYSNTYVPHLKYCFDEIHPDYPKSGGPFCARSVSTTHNYAANVRGQNYSLPSGSVYVYEYVSAYVKPPPAGAMPSDQLPETSDYGPECWARAAPKPGKCSVAQFIYELKDFPQLALKELNKFRNFGKNYLAMEFGWLPFVRDLMSFWTNIRKYDQTLAKLRKDNGQWVRKGCVLKDESSTTTTNDVNPTLFIVPNDAYQSGRVSWVEKTVKEKVWFVGKFRYYIPGLDDSSFIGRVRNFNRVFGVDPTPQLLYEVLPWSWLIDWFSNVGPIIQNWSNINENNLVAKYAYVMRTTETRATRYYRSTTRHRSTYTPNVYTYSKMEIESSSTVTTKSRVAASPFGDFRLSLPDFTPWQLSILAALGLSRIKN